MHVELLCNSNVMSHCDCTIFMVVQALLHHKFFHQSGNLEVMTLIII